VTRPRLLDLFCGAGGAAMGYHQAGFEVVGVDIAPQPRYPFEFHQADAMTFPLDGYDAIHASPPCQSYSDLRAVHQDRIYPDLLTPIIMRLRAQAAPWVVENLDFAPFPPDARSVQLCGSSMGCWRLRRHRWFTGFVPVLVPGCEHWRWGGSPPIGVYGDGGKKGNRGYRGTAGERRRAMGIDWMTRAELSEAIPPAYTRFIAGELLAHLERVA